jgi:hypothetical protein
LVLEVLVNQKVLVSQRLQVRQEILFVLLVQEVLVDLLRHLSDLLAEAVEDHRAHPEQCINTDCM